MDRRIIISELLMNPEIFFSAAAFNLVLSLAEQPVHDCALMTLYGTLKNGGHVIETEEDQRWMNETMGWGEANSCWPPRA